MADNLPTLLITRPAPEAEMLADMIRPGAPPSLRIITSPLITIQPVPTAVTPAAYWAVIFTSVNGVRQSGHLPHRPGQLAFCVGDRTARAARDAGYSAISAEGTAEDLIRLILSHDDEGPLIHLRGAATRGNIAENLGKSGRDVTSAVVYEQRPLPLSAAAQARLAAAAPVLLPLYSPDTAKALLNQAPFAAPLHVIAISEAVADVANSLCPESLTVAERTDGASMVAAIRAALGGKSGLSGP